MSIAPVESVYGEPVSGSVSAFAGSSGAALAPFGGVPYVPTHCQTPKKDGSACSARPVKGTETCYGHSRGTRGN